MNTLFVIWQPDPYIIEIFGRPIAWYGVFWALAFLIGYYIVRSMFRREMSSDIEKADALTDKLLIYMLVASIVGARLGHCLFYEPAYYFANPWKFLAIWEGGLASHGGAIGILIGLWLYSRKTKLSFLSVVDRIVVPVSLAGALIRLGNLFNSEIYGVPTSLPWGFKFVNEYPEGFPLDEIPACHPTQIYEAIFCIITFVWLMILCFKKNYVKEKRGVIFGIFLIMIFGSRFLIEFLKNPQVDFERSMTFDMGQLLSLPFIVVGIWLLVRKRKQ